MTDQLSGIATFVRAVEAGSFARAGELMHVSRSAVGKTIARLEQRLGVRLFHRTTRQQSLTEDGQAFYERCTRALAELDAAVESLGTGRRDPSGHLRVSAPVVFGRQCVAPVLLRLIHKHPRLSLELAFTDNLTNFLEDGVDLAVRIGRLPGSATLTARRLGDQHMAICAAPSYLAEHGRPSSIEDFARHTGIVYSRPGYDESWRIRDKKGQIHELRVNSRLRLDDLLAIADAAISGAGLAWLPFWLIAPHVKQGALELIMDSRHVLAAEVHAIWPQTRYLPTKVRVAIDALAAEVPKLITTSLRPRRS
jgi:DNA-binding transcriptional LysR family regulator